MLVLAHVQCGVYTVLPRGSRVQVFKLSQENEISNKKLRRKAKKEKGWNRDKDKNEEKKNAGNKKKEEEKKDKISDVKIRKRITI